MMYVLFNDIDNFRIANEAIEVALGIPNASELRYADPIYGAYQIAMIVDQRGAEVIPTQYKDSMSTELPVDFFD